MSPSFELEINRQPTTASCTPGTTLLSLLHQQGWMGTHRVCETGDCGSCTVWVDGQPLHSCIYPAQRAVGCSITTIEGLGAEGELTSMQQGFLACQGFQCGYCTPGMVMTAAALEPCSGLDLRRQLDGNLCRCTGYQAIVASILAGWAGPTPAMATPEVGSAVGQSIPKQDGPDIVTGKPVYTGDWSPPGLLHLKLLRSPHAHARIRHINADKARALPGVQAVFTHQDVPRRPYSTAGHGEPVPDPHDHYLLDHKVRFVGDRVAAVVADSVAIAAQACSLIEVDYEVLPHVLDPMVAMGARAAEIGPWSASSSPAAAAPPLLHDEPESFQILDPQHNISGQAVMEKGDVEAGLAQADLVLEQTYQLPAVQHFHLEPHVCVSWVEPDGTVTVRSSTQVPFHCQRVIAELFDLPRERVRVYKGKIGGGFGNKQEIMTEDLCVLATLQTGRPVRWEFTREEEFIGSTSRHAMQIHLRVGMKRDGTLTAMEMRAIANTGAYGNHGEQVVFLTGSMPLGVYRCPNQRFVGRAVYTNTMPAGAFRGYGATQGVFAVECHLDEMARQLGLDSLELRRRQLITADDTVLIGRDHHFHLVGSYGLDQALDQVTQAFTYGPDMPPVVGGPRRRGIGLAIAMQGSGLAKIHQARVRLTLKADGGYEMRSGSVDVGTGSDTTLRQIVAEVLATTVEQIDLITADTRETPFDAGSYASATLYISGQAARLAAEALRDRLLQVGSELLPGNPANLRLAGAAIWSGESAAGGVQTAGIMPLADLAQKATASGHALTVEESYAADASTLTFAVLGAEVEVDTETGRVTVLRCMQALDIGKAINPRICEGQAVGGMVMGLGYALREELRLDDQGRTLNPTPRTYRLPVAKEVPPLQVVLIEQADPYGPFGAKGVGEIGVNCMAPAIANAIAHATGLRLRQLPMTPERVWRALQEASGEL